MLWNRLPGGLHTCHHFSHRRLQNVILVFLFIGSVGCTSWFVLLHSLRLSGHALNSGSQCLRNVWKTGKMNRFYHFLNFLSNISSRLTLIPLVLNGPELALSPHSGWYNILNNLPFKFLLFYNLVHFTCRLSLTSGRGTHPSSVGGIKWEPTLANESAQHESALSLVLFWVCILFLITEPLPPSFP